MAIYVKNKKTYTQCSPTLTATDTLEVGQAQALRLLSYRWKNQ